MSVLADTPIRIKHFRQENNNLRKLLIADELLIHSSVLGELLVGMLPNRAQTIFDLYCSASANHGSSSHRCPSIYRTEQTFR